MKKIALLMSLVLFVGCFASDDSMDYLERRREFLYGDEKDFSVDTFSGVITKEEPSINYEGITFTILPEYIGEPIEASISILDTVKTQEGYDVELFDINAQLPEGLSTLMEISLPYSVDEIQEGSSVYELIYLVLFNEENELWETMNYTVDEANGVLIFQTTHLCTLGKVGKDKKGFVSAGSLDPNDQYGTGGATIDISEISNSPSIPIANLRNGESSNVDFGIFEIKYDTEGLLDTINDYSREQLRTNLLEMDPAYSTLESLKSSESMTEYALGMLGFTSAPVENGTTAAEVIGGSKSFGGVNKLAATIGFVSASAQIYDDYYEGKPRGQIMLNSIKAGGSFATTLLSTYLPASVGAYYFTVFFLGLYVYETLFFPIEDTFDMTSGKGFARHKRYYYAMKDWTSPLVIVNELEDTANKTTDALWHMVIMETYEEALNSVSADEFKLVFREKMDAKIKTMCKGFFTRSVEERKVSLLSASAGWLYGTDDQYHYGLNDPSMTLYQYSQFVITESKGNPKYDTADFGNLFRVESDQIQTITKELNVGKADNYMKEFGVNTGLETELIDLYTNELYSTVITPILNRELKAEQSKIVQAESEAIQKFIDQMNTVITIEFIDETMSEDKEKSIYANRQLIPDITTYQPWKVILDEKGYSKVMFTYLEYLMNGNFDSYKLLKATDVGQISGLEVADKVYPIEVNQNHIIITLDEVDAKILIEGARDITIKVVEGESVEYTFVAKSEYEEECYIVWTFGDMGTEKTDTRESNVTHEFKDAGEYNITAALYDASDIMLATDSVTVAVEVEKPQLQEEDNEVWNQVWELEEFYLHRQDPNPPEYHEGTTSEGTLYLKYEDTMRVNDYGVENATYGEFCVWEASWDPLPKTIHYGDTIGFNAHVAISDTNMEPLYFTGTFSVRGTPGNADDTLHVGSDVGVLSASQYFEYRVIDEDPSVWLGRTTLEFSLDARGLGGATYTYKLVE